jgi:hypothetical protein
MIPAPAESAKQTPSARSTTRVSAPHNAGSVQLRVAGDRCHQLGLILPTQRERRAILQVQPRGKKLGPHVELDVVARETPGFSGAELANLVNEAAIFAVRAGRGILSAGDFAEALDRILLGRREETNARLPDEKRVVAVHESGHALVAALPKHGDPIAKVTILPAGAPPLRKIRIYEVTCENVRTASGGAHAHGKAGPQRQCGLVEGHSSVKVMPAAAGSKPLGPDRPAIGTCSCQPGAAEVGAL